MGNEELLNNGISLEDGVKLERAQKLFTRTWLGLEGLNSRDRLNRPNQPSSTDTLIRLTELVLTLNNFSFNSHHILQTKGVAMGTCMGLSYACLFMGYMEPSLFCTIPHLFLRYIDYCIGFTCTSVNLVYCIRCFRCGLLYIGETERMLGDRFVEHLHSVRDKRLTPAPTVTCPSWASSSVTMTPPANQRSSTSYSALGDYSPM
eukprot:g44444.t1